MYDRSFLLRALQKRRRVGSRLAVAALVAMCAAGCAPSLGGAVRSYEHGRYPEAIEELRAVERDASHWSPSSAARYALYRGLAHLALGDLAAAHRWFDRVAEATQAHPALMSADDAGRLAAARAHLPP